MNVVRSGGPVSHCVFSQAKDGVEVLVEALSDGGVEGAKDARCSAAVSLHARHLSLALLVSKTEHEFTACR